MIEVPSNLPAGAQGLSLGGFNLHAGPVYSLPADGDVRRVVLPVGAKHLNGGGNVHGGVLMTLADIAMSFAARDVSGAPSTATVSLTCDFVGPGQPDDVLEARVRVTRRTRTLVFLSCDIVVGARMIAVATGLWKIA